VRKWPGDWRKRPDCTGTCGTARGYSRSDAPDGINSVDVIKRVRHALGSPLGAIALNVDLLRLTLRGPEELAALAAIERAVAEIAAAPAG
jgi:hypothetical protein